MRQRMSELAIKASNDTLQTSDRAYIQREVDALRDEIDRTGASTQFNNTNLLDGTFTNKNLQVGSENSENNVIRIDIIALTATGLKIDGTQIKVTGTSGVNAKGSIQKIKEALETVSKQRSDLGAIQNRLEHTIKNLDNVVENTQAAESQIRDTDMAEEMVRYSNNNILAQAGQSMLAQANQTNQGVLSLLQ